MKPIKPMNEKPLIVWRIFEDLLKYPLKIPHAILFLSLLMVFFTGCSSAPKQVIPQTTLVEIYQNHQLYGRKAVYMDGFRELTQPEITYLVAAYGLLPDQCVSSPIYSLNGSVYKIEIRCW